MSEEVETIEDEDEELELDHYSDEVLVYVQTHERVNHDLCGEIVKHEEGYVETRLTTTPEMVADGVGLIHGGFVFYDFPVSMSGNCAIKREKSPCVRGEDDAGL